MRHFDESQEKSKIAEVLENYSKDLILEMVKKGQRKKERVYQAFHPYNFFHPFEALIYVSPILATLYILPKFGYQLTFIRIFAWIFK